MSFPLPFSKCLCIYLRLFGVCVFCCWISHPTSLVNTTIWDIKLYLLMSLQLPTSTSQGYFCSQIFFENTGLKLLPRNSLVSGLPWWRLQMKTFPAILPFARGIHWSPVDSPHKGQWRGALMFSLVWAWTNAWANNRDAGDLRRHGAHYGVTAMTPKTFYRGISGFATGCPCND